jgi:membrane-bound lytic murein transglycosylase D
MKAYGFKTTARRTARTAGTALLALTVGLLGTEWMRQRAEQKTGAPGTSEQRPLAGLLELGLGEATPAAMETGWDLSNLQHDRVDYWIGRFQTDKRSDFEAYLARMGRYASIITGALSEREMPRDLLYLAMIESGFDPKAYSSAHASGLWQFIKETGARYGLDVNRAVDERNDPVKATAAALEYLSDLHARFGSWYLAAAAYNTGENRVGRIMREVTGSERGTDADYYRIWDRLPRETRDYVPLMIAAARIAKDPAAYGFDGIETHRPLAFKEVVAKPATSLKKLAAREGTSVSDLKRLNPHLKLDRTRNDEPMVVRIPAEDAVQTAD